MGTSELSTAQSTLLSAIHEHEKAKLAHDRESAAYTVAKKALQAASEKKYNAAANVAESLAKVRLLEQEQIQHG